MELVDDDGNDQLNILKNPDRYLNKIQDENKIVRRDAIKALYVDLKIALDETLQGHSVLGDTEQEVMLTFLRPIILLVKDPVEKTRELAYELLGIFVLHLPKEKINEVIPTLIPLMVERLGQPELNEPSEEVRLIAVKRIEDVLKKLKTDLNPFIDDILQILSSTITDPYHMVRIVSCQLTSKVADVCRTVFHYNSERLLRPLCMSINHQQMRVRVAVVDCLCQVVLLGNHKGINTVIPHIISRVFDPAPAVRLAVINAVGEWMVNFIDRYSYFPKLIPIILSLQKDETDEIPKRARALWDAAGEKYLSENLEKYRDQIDFPLPQPSHYPPNVERSNLGCRIITWQFAYNILPALATETSDWVKSTRVKATLLLYYTILNCEEKITMYVGKIFPIIYKTIRDDEPEIVSYTEQAANAIGYFVPLSATWPILCSAVSMGASEGNLLILKSVLEGTDPQILSDFVEPVLEVLSAPDVLESRNQRRQFAILAICKTLLKLAPGKVCDEGPAPIFFRIVLTTWAQCQDVQTAQSAKSIMEDLGNNFNTNLDGVMGKFTESILTEMAGKKDEWTPVSTDKLIFDVVLSQGGLAVDNNMDSILKIMLSNLNPEKDPEVRLKFLTRLAQHLEFYSKTTAVNKTQLQTFVQRIIQDVLGPNLVWVAGKTAGVIRTAAVSCLLAVLQTGILDSNAVYGLGSKIVTGVLGVIDDSSETTRIFSCECLRKLVIEAKGGLGAELIHKMYPAMLKRLDDVSDTVRLGALNAIAAIFTHLPSTYNPDRYQPFIENVYTTLLLHLDDTDVGIQNKVQDVLEAIGHLRPDSLITECEKTKMKHRTPARCDELISKFSELVTN